MSSGSGTGAPSAGVVRNSALSFVACAQPMSSDNASNLLETDREQIEQDRLVPAGLKALCDACSRLYPDQPNPLQVTTRLKYWLGGHDPLDYISMYWNPGKPEEHIPPHWHYISFGLSDLHGDGRVHALVPRCGEAVSGCGFELTFRLASAPHAPPPLWPAALLQALARYVFTTGNKFCAGDHISWHRPLDGESAGSRVRQLLVAAEPQLPPLAPPHAPHGSVTFLQIVGCTGRELKAAQRGSGIEVLKLISEDPKCGGAWLVTRAHRSRSAARVTAPRARPHPHPRAHPPAQLAGVSARLRWAPWPQEGEDSSLPASLPERVQQQIKDTLQRGLYSMADRTAPEGHMSTDSFEMSSIERALPHVPELMQGSWRSEDSVEYLNGAHIVLNAEGASLLPLAIDGRVSHGRHFTWREAGRAVTVAPAGLRGALACPRRPAAARGGWLQVVIPKELAEDMSQQVACLARLADTDSEPDSEGEACQKDGEPPALPLTLAWPKHKLKITVLPDRDFL